MVEYMGSGRGACGNERAARVDEEVRSLRRRLLPRLNERLIITIG